MNKLPTQVFEQVWAILNLVVLAHDVDADEPVTSSESLVTTIHGGFSGRAVETLVEFVLSLIRRSDGSFSVDAQDRFRILLTEIQNNGTTRARASLGQLLPWELRYATDWSDQFIPWLAHRPGLANLVECPEWGAYILQAPFWADIFDRLRPVYGASARQIGPSEIKAQRVWSFNEHFVQHVVAALLHGRAHVGDPDRLIEETFQRVSIADRTLGYWMMWRQLADSNEEFAAQLSARIILFWKWRLDYLESLPDSVERKDEAKGLACLVVATALPAAEAVSLAGRTLRLSNGELQINSGFWQRAVDYAKADSSLVLDVIEPVIRAELRQGWDPLSLTEVGPVLTTTLGGSDQVAIRRAKKIIHDIGEHGLDSFGTLLTGGDAPSQN
jgi:hypothetical protein